MKRIFKIILGVCFGLALALTTLEGLIRIFQPLEFRVKGDKINLPLNKKYIFTNDKIDKLDRVIVHSKNSLGFRGEELPYNFQDYLTIIVVGGSTTECLLVSDGKTWIDILGRDLKSRFSQVWLNNAGLDGQSTFGHLVLMEDFIIKLKPKLVLFLVGANDQSLIQEDEADKKFTKKKATGILLNYLNKSEVFNYAVNFRRFLKAKKMHAVHENFDVTQAGSFWMPEKQAAALRQFHRDQFLIPYRMRLVKLIKLCRDQAIEPVFMTQPSLLGEATDSVTGVDLGKINVGGIDGKTTWDILEFYNEVLREVTRENHVALIDLARELPKSSAYFYDSLHFTNAGCEKVADLVFTQLSPRLAEEFPGHVRGIKAANLENR